MCKLQYSPRAVMADSVPDVDHDQVLGILCHKIAVLEPDRQRSMCTPPRGTHVDLADTHGSILPFYGSERL